MQVQPTVLQQPGQQSGQILIYQQPLQADGQQVLYQQQQPQPQAQSLQTIQIGDQSLLYQQPIQQQPQQAAPAAAQALQTIQIGNQVIQLANPTVLGGNAASNVIQVPTSNTAAGQVIMMVGGEQRAQQEQPEILDDQPLYVNAKQYHRILKRRQQRAKLEAQGRIPKERRKYLHESRHRHAMNRQRGEGGKFHSKSTTGADVKNEQPLEVPKQ